MRPASVDAAAISHRFWRGTDQAFGWYTYHFCRLDQGWSELMSQIAADAASFGQGCWAQVAKTAKVFGCSESWVNETYARMKEIGLMYWRLLRKNEVPPGLRVPIDVGGALRTVVGRNKSEAEKPAVYERTALANQRTTGKEALRRHKNREAAERARRSEDAAQAETERRQRPIQRAGDLVPVGQMAADLAKLFSSR